MESTNNKIDFNNENIFDIVIIGAGVAGMTAAQELIKKNS